MDFLNPEELDWKEISLQEFQLNVHTSLEMTDSAIQELEARRASVLALVRRANMGLSTDMTVKFLYCEEIGALQVTLDIKPKMGF